MSRTRDLRFRKPRLKTKQINRCPRQIAANLCKIRNPGATHSRHCLKSVLTIISERKKCGSHWWIKLGNLIRYAKSHSIFRREPKVIVVEVRPLLWRSEAQRMIGRSPIPASPCSMPQTGERGIYFEKVRTL